jgi:hypothetical protein
LYAYEDGIKLEENHFMHDKDQVYIVQADNLVQSSKLLLVLASTVILGFEQRREDP